MSTSNNDKTIDAYNQDIQGYAKNTPDELNPVVAAWLDDTVDGIAKTTKILEIGSGLGKDADYLEQNGYRVVRTDAARGFVDYMQKNGAQAELLNPITDDVPAGYDIVFADAVLLHFTRVEAALVCKKIFESLNAPGRFSLRLKIGDGEEWVSDKLGHARFMCYWQKDEIEKVLKDAGFSNISIKIVPSRRAGITWMGIIARKEGFSE